MEESMQEGWKVGRMDNSEQSNQDRWNSERMNPISVDTRPADRLALFPDVARHRFISRPQRHRRRPGHGRGQWGTIRGPTPDHCVDE